MPSGRSIRPCTRRTIGRTGCSKLLKLAQCQFALKSDVDASVARRIDVRQVRGHQRLPERCEVQITFEKWRYAVSIKRNSCVPPRRQAVLADFVAHGARANARGPARRACGFRRGLRAWIRAGCAPCRAAMVPGRRHARRCTAAGELAIAGDVSSEERCARHRRNSGPTNCPPDEAPPRGARNSRVRARCPARNASCKRVDEFAREIAAARRDPWERASRENVR